MSVAIIGTCAAFTVWFAHRAALGLRVRRLAGVRLGPVAGAWSLASGPVARASAAGALCGVAFGGTPGGAAGAVLGAVARPVLDRRRTAGRAQLLDRQVPEMLRSIAAALRAGRNVPQALEAAREEASPPLRDVLDEAAGALRVGASMDAALDALEHAAGIPAAASAVETIRIGRAAGGDLPAVLDAAVEAMTERERIERDRRAATSQARLSGMVVGAMPLLFFVIAGPTAREQLSFLFTEPVGWVLLGLGAGLEAAGAAWMRSLMRPR